MSTCPCCSSTSSAIRSMSSGSVRSQRWTYAVPPSACTSTRHLLELFLRARHQQHVAPGPADLQCRGLADPLRGAGDHHVLRPPTAPGREVGEHAAGCRNALPEGTQRLDAADGEVRDVGRRHCLAPYHRALTKGNLPLIHSRLRASGAMRTYVRSCLSSSASCFPAFSSPSPRVIGAGLMQTPAALAPEPGGTQQIGEASLAAEAFGVHPGMRLGEALARCPRLMLVPPDPAGVADFWERLLVRLESIGAAVEPERPGLVCFDAAGLLRLHGGIDGVLAAARRALRTPARFGVASSRFAAVAAATRARVRRPEIVAGDHGQGERCPGSCPRVSGSLCRSSLLRARPALADLPDALGALGGEHAGRAGKALRQRRWPTASALAGLLAHELAGGGDGALRPRPAAEFLRESLELPEAGIGNPARASAGPADRSAARAA